MVTDTKTGVLPSLLDRLTDEAFVNQSRNVVKQEIKRIESELNQLAINLSKPDSIDETINTSKTKQQDLKLQLNNLRAQDGVLSAAISSKQDLYACVKRDLEWLLNANQFFWYGEQENFPEAASSVVNYGIPDLAGKTLSGLDLTQLERQLFQTIINFEPRIMQKTLSVKVIADPVKNQHNILIFEIKGELCARPQPIHLHLRTEFELENSQVVVHDAHAMRN